MMFGSPWSPCFLKDLRHHISDQVALGFLSQADIPNEAIAVYSGLLEELVSVLVPEILIEHVQAEQRWPTITDFDKLTTAFNELGTEGIVCWHNVGTTVADAIESVVTNLNEESRGYAFYTATDAVNALSSKSLRIGFGVNEKLDHRPDAELIGQAVADALQRHGLEVQWNGAMASCITATIDWKRRWISRGSTEATR